MRKNFTMGTNSGVVLGTVEEVRAAIKEVRKRTRRKVIDELYDGDGGITHFVSWHVDPDRSYRAGVGRVVERPKKVMYVTSFQVSVRSFVCTAAQLARGEIPIADIPAGARPYRVWASSPPFSTFYVGCQSWSLSDAARLVASQSRMRAAGFRFTLGSRIDFRGYRIPERELPTIERVVRLAVEVHNEWARTHRAGQPIRMPRKRPT